MPKISSTQTSSLNATQPSIPLPQLTDELLGIQHTGHESTLHSALSTSTSLSFSTRNVSEARICWIAAEHALQHARSKLSSVSEVFNRWKIPESEYHVQAGFDESLIKFGNGYLEEIHIFVSTEVDASSPLLSELGRLFSPFSSILFTEVCSHRLPVFKNDGSIWEYGELVYFTASKFADGGKSAKLPLTIISYSQSLGVADGVADLLQGGSGGGEGGEGRDMRTDKGKGRDRGDKDEADGDDKDDIEDVPGGQGRNITGPASISFNIASDIYPIHDAQNVQTLTVHGSLIIETTPLVQRLFQYPERRVQFTNLIFDTEPRPDIAYRLFHVKVVVDSQQKNAFDKVIQPKRTPYFDSEERLTSSSEIGQTRGMTVGLTLEPQPQASIAGTSTMRNHENTAMEKKRYRSAIRQHSGDGKVHWAFDIDDPNLQKRGIDMPENVLPITHFTFVGDSSVPAPPPRYMDVVITSYWSMIPPDDHEPRGTWIQKLLRLFKGPGNNSTIPYSNLIKLDALKTVLDPPEGSGPCHYEAKVNVRSGTGESPQGGRAAADSVNMTSQAVDDSHRSRTFDIPTIANSKLSPHCIRTFEDSPHNLKSL